MEKKYYFLAGLPRSGNTLLSSILNQNPDIYSSPLSPITTMLWDFEKSASQNENVIRLNNISPVVNVAKNIIINYYSEITKPIIIDREKAWGTEPNLRLIKKYITEKPKIIFTVRPIIEVLASFINILPDYSYVDKAMEESNWWYKDYLTKNDNRCDFLMQPNQQIDQTLLSINEIIKNENKDIFWIVEYKNIVNDPQNTMNGIYDFLQIPRYQHDFNNIIQVNDSNDEKVGQSKNMHEVRTKLTYISKNPKEILSDYVINKYSNMGWGIE
jgi:sulfotransferase